MVANVVGGVAVRHLPHELAAIEIDRRQHAVRRFHDRQSLHREAGARTVGRLPSRRGQRLLLLRPLRRVGRAAVARPHHLTEFLSRKPRHVADVGESFRRRDERPRADGHVARLREHGVRLRIRRRPRPVGRRRRDDGAVERTGRVADDRRREWRRLVLVFLQPLERLRTQFRREVDQIVRHLQIIPRVGRRLRRKRLRRRCLFARHGRLRHRLLVNRPDRLPGHAIEHVEPSKLARQGHRLDSLAVHIGVQQQRRRRIVEVPDRMVHQLEVPLALAGLQIDADQGVAEQIVAGPMAAVEVRRRIFDGQVYEARFFVDGDLRPNARVAVDRPRFVFPRVVAELAGLRNRVERPQELAGLHVERAHEPLRVVVRGDRCALAHRRADDHDVLHDGGRRVHADLAGFQIDLLALAFDGAELQIEDAALAEGRHERAVFRAQLDELIARRDVNHAIVALAVGPERHAASGQLPRRDGGALALAQAVRPHHLARPSVERDDRSPRAAGRVENAFDRERRAFELVLGPRAQVVGLEPPRDLELVEVARVDLVERRVARAVHVGRVVRPVAVLRRGLTGGLAEDARAERRERERESHECG